MLIPGVRSLPTRARVHLRYALSFKQASFPIVQTILTQKDPPANNCTYVNAIGTVGNVSLTISAFTNCISPTHLNLGILIPMLKIEG